MEGLEQLFMAMHPGFFDQDSILNMPEEEVFCEMLLDLKDFDENIYQKHLGDNISFGIYRGSLDAIQDKVAAVDSKWKCYFDGALPIYCGYVGADAVSFCLIDDFGIHKVGEREVRIGGPGCVGTIPQYRDRGIGLTMVKNAIALLKQECYDYAYIHYTGDPQWYAKLGFQTCLRWNKAGFLHP